MREDGGVIYAGGQWFFRQGCFFRWFFRQGDYRTVESYMRDYRTVVLSSRVFFPVVLSSREKNTLCFFRQGRTVFLLPDGGSFVKGVFLLPDGECSQALFDSNDKITVGNIAVYSDNF